jgi:hypothetical protein
VLREQRGESGGSDDTFQTFTCRWARFWWSPWSPWRGPRSRTRWIVRTWGKAGTYEAHRHIDVCDEAVDSSVVSTRFHLYGVATTQVLEDPDGGGGSCGHEPNLRVNVIDHRLCGSAQGCTAITYH